MQSFIDLLNEAENIVMTKDFIKNVEDYVFKNDQKYAKLIKK